MNRDDIHRTESIQDVRLFIDELRAVLSVKKSEIYLLEIKSSEAGRPKFMSNIATISELFPDEFPHIALRRELMKLSHQMYMHSMADMYFPLTASFHVFGMRYGDKDVYIKLKIEFETDKSLKNGTVIVISFHYSTKKFSGSDFPYGGIL
jgi:hypothetical protein